MDANGTEIQWYLKPNSITLASSELEPASVIEFGFSTLILVRLDFSFSFTSQ